MEKEVRNSKTIKNRIYCIIEIGSRNDLPSKLFDFFIVFVILLNLAATLAYTFESFNAVKGLLDAIELITVLIFTVEYILRIWTADQKYAGMSSVKAALRFAVSFYGIIDLLTFLPYYIPVIFPAGIVAFRILRVFRIFRLFQVNAQYDAYNVITSVLYEKRNQLISSVCLIFILMLASSLSMYSLEHEAQPDAFKNAFSGMWWSVSAMLTVGYGDIYPITTAGKILAIATAFLGVGLVAIPTGIISAGFVQQYTAIKSGVSADTKTDPDFLDCANCPWRQAYLQEHQELLEKSSSQCL